MNDDTVKKKLIWQCRRGTRELDWMVLYFLHNHYNQVNTECKEAFAELLKLPDPELHDVLTGTQATQNPVIAEIRQIICQNVPAQVKQVMTG